jgi:thymidylate kinase
VLPTIAELIKLMDGGRITYCHWKSNWVLADTLEGKTDLDLLIDRGDASSFRSVLRDLGFRPAIETSFRPLPSVEHYHALDEQTKAISHVHAYYRVISGESLTKNYHLPLEEMLLENRRTDGPIPTPTPGAELIVFVLRILIKYSSPGELALILRDAEAVRQEAEWLMTATAIDEAMQLLPKWLPQVEGAFFGACVDALRTPGKSIRRIGLGLRLRRRLRGFARRGMPRVWLAEASMFTTKAWNRIAGSRKKLTPGGGGAVIAFVGSEASGKSTLLAATEEWLAQHFTVTRIHAGKPPGTAATFIPHVLLPLLRRMLPRQRTTRVEAGGITNRAFPLMFGIRAVMLAYERKALLTRAFTWSSNGTIVLCDRYPSARIGAADSPQLRNPGGGAIRRALANLETRLYRDTPAPDLVIHLHAPLDVTLARNKARDKTEPEDYVRLRHATNLHAEFPGVTVHRIDTARPLSVVVDEVKRLIWDAL